ncbi:MAG: hypothetical protein ACHQ2F_08650 [Desulfobaccales bacterium]
MCSNSVEVQAVRFKGKIVLFALMLVLVMAGSALAQEKEKPFLWNGNQWPQLSFDAKVGYVKGVGNLADFENGVSKSKGNYVARAFADELKNKSVSQVIEQVDKFYKENPGKLDTSVLEVIVIRCTKFCPPGMGAGVK